MDKPAQASGIHDDPQNLQYTPPNLGSDRLIGGDLFVGLGNFDFFNTAKEKARSACS